MINLFEIAARKKFRFASPKGVLTTEQLFDLPLTSAAGRANLNDIAIGISDELEKTSTRSFVTNAASTPQRQLLSYMLDVLKAVIAIKEGENAALAASAERRRKRDKVLEALDAAEGRELGSKSVADLRAELAALDD